MFVGVIQVLAGALDCWATWWDFIASDMDVISSKEHYKKIEDYSQAEQRNHYRSEARYTMGQKVDETLYAMGNDGRPLHHIVRPIADEVMRLADAAFKDILVDHDGRSYFALAHSAGEGRTTYKAKMALYANRVLKEVDDLCESRMNQLTTPPKQRLIWSTLQNRMQWVFKGLARHGAATTRNYPWPTPTMAVSFLELFLKDQPGLATVSPNVTIFINVL